MEIQTLQHHIEQNNSSTTTVKQAKGKSEVQ
jgi:hypothetical protein